MKPILILLLCLTITGCVEQPPVVKLFKQHLGKEIDLSGYDSVYCRGVGYSYGEFRKQYPYITVNYVDEDCSSCKVKVREWCNNIDKLTDHSNLAYLFVFRGTDYHTFLKYSQGEVDFPFFIMPSTEFTYVQNNSGIDRQIIDGGFLLNSDDEIKAIGDPFLSPELTALFDEIVTKNK